MKYFLNFYAHPDAGRQEGFFHFMWGYCMPAINEIIKREAIPCSGEQRHEYRLLSGEQELNSIFIDIFHRLKIDIEFVEKEVRDKDINEIMIPRWDLYLIYEAALMNMNLWLLVKNIVKEVIIFRRIPRTFNFRFQRKEIIRTRNLILKHCLSEGHQKNKLHPNDGGINYILERSTHKVDDPKKGNSPKDRRSLLNVGEVISKLEEKSIAVKSYDSGSDHIVRQIQKFNKADVVIAIRGGELANVAWMKEGAKVIVFDPFNQNNNPSLSMPLAKLFKVDYISFREGICAHHSLSSDVIDRIVNLIMNKSLLCG